MNYIKPLKLDQFGNLAQFQLQELDWIALNVGGVGQKFRGSVAPMSGTTRIPFDNSAPTTQEGTLVWSQEVTPQEPNSVFRIEFETQIDISAINKNVTIAIFRDSTCINTRTTSASAYNGLSTAPLHIVIYDPPGAGTFTYSCRIGIDSSGTWYMGQGSSQSMGGVNASWWSINEEL